MPLLQLLGSLAAVFAVAALVWWMGLGKSPAIASEEDALKLARDAHSGFRPLRAIVDSDGRAALVHGEGGETILLKPHGAQVAARVFKSPPETRYEEGRLIVATGDRMYGDVALATEESRAADWISQDRILDHG